MHAEALEQYIKAWEPTYGPDPMKAQDAEALAAFKAKLIAQVNDPRNLDRGLSLRGQEERLQELIQEQMLTWRNEQLEKIFAASTVDEHVQIAQLVARIAVDPTAAVELAQVQARLGEAASVYGASVEKPLVDAAAEQALDAKLAPPPPPNTLEGMRYALGKRVDDMLANPPAGAKPEEIAELRDDLRVLADNFRPAPNQPVGEAFDLVQREVRSTLDDFIKTEAAERQQEMEVAQANQAKADMEGFQTYGKHMVDEYINKWEPEVAGVWDKNDLTRARGEWAAKALDPLRFKEGIDLRAQEQLLEDTIKAEMRIWRNDQYVKAHDQNYQQNVLPRLQENQRIIADPASTPLQREEAQIDIKNQQPWVELAQAALKSNLEKPIENNQTLEAKLDEKLAPAAPPPVDPPVKTFEKVKLDEALVAKTELASETVGVVERDAAMKVADVFDEGATVMATVAASGVTAAAVREAVDDDVVMGDAGAADMTMAAATTPTAATAPAAPPPEVPPPPGMTPSPDATETYDPYASGVGELDQTGTGDVDDPLGVDDITGPDDSAIPPPDDPTVPDPNDRQDQQF